MTQPFEGFAAVVQARSIGAAYCGRVLADAGAAVTVIEPPDGHPLRRWRCDGEVAPDDDGALFRYLHHGMGSVVSATDVDADSLLADADVLVTDRLDAADIAARYPELVVLAITPWGLTGPDAGRPAV